MKSLTIIVAALVVTLVLNGPIQSYADPQLDTLVNIATQARNNLNISISQISNVPSDIASLYKQGSDETDALTKAANAQDIASAKQHFLSAMNFFKQTNDKISSLNATEASDQQRSDVTKLQSEITRLDKIAGTLRTIAITNHVDFDFTPFDTSIQQAKQALDAGKIDDASKSIDAANQMITDAHHAISETAQKMTSDRAKDFTEKQVARFNKLSPPLNVTQTVAPPVSNVTTSNTTSSSTPVENPGEMIAKLRKLVAEGNVDEALKIIKSLDAYQKETEQNNQNAVQTVQNSTNPTTIPPPENSTEPTNAAPNPDESIPSSVPPVNSTGSTTPSVPPPIPQLQTNSSSVSTDNSSDVTVPAPTNSSNTTSGHEDRDREEQHRVIPQTANVQNNTNPIPLHSNIPSSVPPTNSSKTVTTNSSNTHDQTSENKKKSVFRIIPPLGNFTHQESAHDKKNHEQSSEKSRHGRQSWD